MTSPHGPAPGPIETRMQTLVGEVFDGADVQAATLTPLLKGRTAAFILLAHAEIEYALEQACFRISGLVRNCTDPATAMLAWGFMAVKSGSESPKTPLKNNPLADLATAYESLVGANHGVKEKNLQSLLVPIGVEIEPLKTDVFALDDFGRRRGDLAHRPLSSWSTTDLPSTHVESAVQAARAADRVVSAIASKHSAILPSLRRPKRRFGQWVATLLRQFADRLEQRSK